MQMRVSRLICQRKFQMQTVMPEDMLVFLAQQWFPNHAGSATSSAELIAAHNSLDTVKSHLSKEVELLVRTGDRTTSCPCETKSSVISSAHSAGRKRKKIITCTCVVHVMMTVTI